MLLALGVADELRGKRCANDAAAHAIQKRYLRLSHRLPGGFAMIVLQHVS